MFLQLGNSFSISLLWLLAETNVSKTEQFLDFLDKNQLIGWGIAGFGVVATAIAAVAAFTGNIDAIISFLQKYCFRKKPEITEEQRQKVREDLIEIGLGQVVKRLEDSLHNKIRIDLKREEQRQRVGQQNLPAQQGKEVPDNLIKRSFKRLRGSAPPKSFSLGKSTLELFEQEDIEGRLLILGEPGSGKTNELLVLAKDLLQQAKASPELPIPVIFELSEWNVEQEFEDWLSQKLLEQYNISFAISRHWIRNRQLIPLLDGLDELRRVDDSIEYSEKQLDEHRQAKQILCVRAINTFLDKFSLPLVVCCRRIEYEAIEFQGELLKRLNGAIYLKPLETEQIQEYLQKLNRSQLWKSIQSQPELLKLVSSPLFLLILIVAYKGQNIHCTDKLIDEYIHKQNFDLNNQGAYPIGKTPTPEKTYTYLGWLASKLDVTETTEFLIERLQPSWIDNREHLNWYRFLYTMMTCGLFHGLVSGVREGLTYGLIYELIFGLIFGLLFYFISEFQPIYGFSSIKTAGKMRFSRDKLLNAGLTYGLVGGLFFGLILGVHKGLFGGLLFGLYGALELDKFDVKYKMFPNQGIRDSIRNGLILGLIIGLIVGLFFGLSVGFFFGLFFGLSSGLNSAHQHLYLRMVLWKSGVAPWNYARFLEHAENLRFIQRVGGRYRFVHDLIRKRFTKRYEEINSFKRISIRILSTSFDNVPQNISQAWTGIEIPLPASHNGLPKRYRVIRKAYKHSNIIFEYIKLIYNSEYMEGYAVNTKIAIDILSRSSPEAAAWWHNHAPELLQRSKFLVFESEDCELIYF